MSKLSDRLLCIISICKFGSFKNSFATITSLSELYFRFRRFTLLVQMKKVISINYGSSTSSWKPWGWVRLDLIFSLRDIYINPNLNPLAKFTSSNRSTKLKDILPWNISQMITKTTPISTRVVISYAIKRGILVGGISGGIIELEGIIYNLNWYLSLLLHFYIFFAFWANQIKLVVKWSLKITEIKPIFKKSWENAKTKEAKKIKPTNFIHEKYSKVTRNHKTRLEPLNSQ